MGALHEGHLSLARASIQRCDKTVASIYVNPTQFGPSEDLDKYPRTFERDLELLDAQGVAAVFAPDNDSMYPAGFSTFVEPPEVAMSLEGIYRPTHFRGVTTIVAKLFLAAPVTHAFFGLKDYQQWKVIEAMTRDLNMGIEIVPCEIVRERDGLAMSSRNRYLRPQERSRALLLWRTLEATRDAVTAGETDVAALQARMRRCLAADDATQVTGVDRLDYAVVVDAQTLAAIERIDRDAVALIAAVVDGTRLIDNVELKPNLVGHP